MVYLKKRSHFKKILGAFTVIISLGLLAGCHHSSPEDKIQKVSERIASKLDFNDQQKNILNDITSDLKKDFKEEKNIRLSHQDDIKKLILADTLDKDKIKVLIKERQERMNAKIDK